jgi:hypothetical protein
VILPLHLGDLHAYEQWLVALIAFGPFVVLGIVVYVVRGREPADDDSPDGTPSGEE